MEIKNTPLERFQNLKDFNFTENFFVIEEGLHMHYLDEGPSDAEEIILLMHGEPSWCYLYRFMIPVLTEAGYRCLAPDLIGFGKSSKPSLTTDYTYARHVEWCQKWLDSLNINGLTLFAQDWGGMIGLRLVDNVPDKFSRICISNTGLATGDHKMTEAFLKWQKFSQKVESFPFETILQGATERELTNEELAAYRAPFPDESYTAGARIFPALVPTQPNDPASEPNRLAWKNTFMKWTKPFLTLFSDKDPVTGGGEKVWQKLVPGAKNQKHQIIKDGGHFVQEDKGVELSELLIEFINSNP